MKLIEFEVTGVPPGVMMNNPASMKLRGKGTRIKTIPTPEEEARAKCYRLDGGQLYVPSNWFRASLIDGGIGRRVGRRGASKLIQSTVFNTDAFCVLTDPESGESITEYEIDVRRAVVQTQGVMRARPLVFPWMTRVEFEYDEDFLTVALVQEVFEIAGRTVGVGDYRPRCPKGKGGPFGRYIIRFLREGY